MTELVDRLGMVKLLDAAIGPIKARDRGLSGEQLLGGMAAAQLAGSTRRRQDAPDLPRRPVEKPTVGRVFAGSYRPWTFLTLTLDSYGRVDSDGAAIDPDRYDYRQAARDAIHFPALLDRFWHNTRRCVGWDVQYFGTVEPHKRGAPHFHAAIRGAIPRAELHAITTATYHQVWWPAHDQLIYGGDRLPVWDIRAKAFTDPDTATPLPT